MGKIEELLNKCKNKTRFMPLKDLIIRGPKSPSGVKQISEMKEGEFLAFTSGNKRFFIDQFLVDGEYIFMNDGGVADTKFYTGKAYYSDHVLAFTTNELLYPNFLYHYLLSINDFINDKLFVGSGLKNLNKSKFFELLIPVPPMEAQIEIAKILSNFAELTAELTAELSLRKSQYNFYSSNLFPSIETNVKWIELGKIATVTKLAGFEFTKYVNYSEEGKIIALRGLNVKNGHLALDDVKYIDNSDLSMLKRSKLVEGDLLYTYVGTVGQTAIVTENDKYYLAPNVALIRINNIDILPKYVMYYLLTDIFKVEQVNKLLQASSMQNIPMEKIRLFKIPVLPIDEQKRIISILDQFDKFMSDINEGLPAEIDLRKKQYFYYRERLFNFKEAKE